MSAVFACWVCSHGPEHIYLKLACTENGPGVTVPREVSTTFHGNIGSLNTATLRCKCDAKCSSCISRNHWIVFLAVCASVVFNKNKYISYLLGMIFTILDVWGLLASTAFMQGDFLPSISHNDVLIPAVIMQLRVYAMYERCRKVLVLLCVCFLLESIAAITILYYNFGPGSVDTGT
jgi:hypothetical protein